MRPAARCVLVSVPLVRHQQVAGAAFSPRRSRYLRHKYGPAWRFVVPSSSGPPKQLDAHMPVLTSSSSTFEPLQSPAAVAELEKFADSSVRDAQKSVLALKPLPARVTATLRMCFHLLIRNRLVDAAVAMYHRLVEFGIQMQRSDLSVLLWNLPYDRSATVAGSEEKDWTGVRPASWKDRSAMKGNSTTTVTASSAKSATTTAAAAPVSQSYDSSELSPRVEPTASLPRRDAMVAESERPTWLRRWIDVEVAMGNIDLNDARRFSRPREAPARTFAEQAASNVLDQRDAALVNAAHSGLCTAEIEDVSGSIEPLPLIEHLTVLQGASDRLQKLKRFALKKGRKKSAYDSERIASGACWSEALHLASMFLTTQQRQPTRTTASARLLQACAESSLHSSSWTVQHSYLTTCSRCLPRTSMMNDMLVPEVTVRMLINVLDTKRCRPSRSAVLQTMVGACCEGSESVQKSLDAMLALSKIESSNAQSRGRKINIRQLVSDCMTAAKVATSHLFIDVSRFIQDEKRKAAIAVSISHGVYTPPTATAQIAKTDVIYSRQCLSVTLELVCAVAGRLAQLLPSYNLLQLVKDGGGDGSADDFVRDLFFGPFGIMESRRLLSPLGTAAAVRGASQYHYDIRLSGSLAAFANQGFSETRVLSASVVLQILHHLRLLSAEGVKSSPMVVAIGRKCVMLGAASAQDSSSRERSEVGKKLILEGLTLLQQSGQWMTIDFRRRGYVNRLWSSQLGRQIRDRMSATEAKRIQTMLAAAPSRGENSVSRTRWPTHFSSSQLQNPEKMRTRRPQDAILSPGRMEALLSRSTELSEIRSALGTAEFVPTILRELGGAPWDKALRIAGYLVQNARIRPRVLPASVFAATIRALRTTDKDTWLEAVQVFWAATERAALPSASDLPSGISSRTSGSLTRAECVMLDVLLGPLVKTLAATRHILAGRDVIKIWEKVCAQRSTGIDRRKQFLAYAAINASESLQLGVALRDAGVEPDQQMSEEFHRVAVATASLHSWSHALGMLSKFVGTGRNPSAGAVRAALRILRESPSNLDRQAMMLYNARDAKCWNSSCTFHLVSILNRKKLWSQALSVLAHEVSIDTAPSADDEFGQQLILQGLRACAIGGQVEPGTVLYELWKRSASHTSSEGMETFAERNEMAREYFFRAMTKPITRQMKEKSAKAHSKDSSGSS